MVSDDGPKPQNPKTQKPARRLVSLKGGARTWSNAACVEQRACRAGPEGVSLIELSSMEVSVSPKAKNPP